MPLLGAHMSIAGGYYKAIEAAAALDMQSCQLFTKSNQQWRAKPLAKEDVTLFQRSLQGSGVQRLIAHAAYLINLAAPADAVFRQSVEAFVIEMRRAEALGLDYLVVHPGGFGDSSMEIGISRVVSALDEIHRRCPKFRVRILLETTAGQGNSVGYRFEQLAGILNSVKESERLGVCVDTCHVFAAGYPLAPRPAYQATFRMFDQLVGIERIEAFHLNDSVKPIGSRIDRHAHIGRGAMGLEPFRLVLNDRRLARLPMVFETPKGMENGQDLDAINLATLRGLIKRRNPVS